MTFSALTVVVIAIIALLVALGLLWAYLVANRLDRLHVRSDLSWQALDAALARRAVVARAVGDALKDEQLIKLAAKAERAERDRREYAENQLAAALSTVDLTGCGRLCGRARRCRDARADRATLSQ